MKEMKLPKTVVNLLSGCSLDTFFGDLVSKIPTLLYL